MTIANELGFSVRQDGKSIVVSDRKDIDILSSPAEGSNVILQYDGVSVLVGGLTITSDSNYIGTIYGFSCGGGVFKDLSIGQSVTFQLQHIFTESRSL